MTTESEVWTVHVAAIKQGSISARSYAQRPFRFTLVFCVNELATAPAPWTEIEFKQLDLGDARLNKRARILIDRFTADPTASVPKACQGWGETMAAYRFLDNDSIDWRAIMAPHWQQTQQRMAAQPVVLCLQDTTELDFNGKRSTNPSDRHRPQLTNGRAS